MQKFKLIRICKHMIITLTALIIFLSIWQMITRRTFTEPIIIPPNEPENKLIASAPEGYATDSDDYKQLIDLKNFTFTIFNKVCDVYEPLLLILVRSQPKNALNRKTIRKTWGRKGTNYKLVFLVGSVQHKKLQSHLELENAKHGDLIQGNFLDTYKNLTYKQAMVFKYALYHCPQATHILKTDDDVFINTITLDALYASGDYPFNMQNLMFCNIIHDDKPVHYEDDKWHVSYEEFSREFYPDYCQGWFTLYTRNVVRELYDELQKSSYFRLEDVYISGIIAEKLNLQHDQCTNILYPDDQDDFIGGKIKFTKPFLFGPYDVGIKTIREMWNYIISRNETII